MAARHRLHQQTQTLTILRRGHEVKARVQDAVGMDGNAMLRRSSVQQTQQRSPVPVVSHHDLTVLCAQADQVRKSGDDQAG
jgi:hypothetical protein